ncbi:glycosyltransferase family 4 protein [Methanoculleus sp. Wushi-C6]|uniref:Glycosyltransferase family 4 protein n=1 Tax=Methanoculleus caldifontis TaxID=2651577 RepID=A0ABU3WYC7_9EURY|nr:glycosyltransferase [Methanoculleus sp. Wushi-C6]MDV2480805.1 glycosyltransferase family 4 protein [Methanoculleus sp. Wushi-C6]
MRILLVSTQDYIHHPIPSRHHNIFEELAKRHEVHVPHFHVSRGKERETLLHVHEATQFAVESPFLHYTFNAPCHYRVIRDIIRDHDIDIVVGAHVLAGTAMVRAAKKAGVPVVFDLKDWFPDSAAAYYKNPGIKWLLREGVLAITRYNLDHSDVVTTVSPGLVEKLRSYGYEAELITNGVNTDLFHPMDGGTMRSALGIAPDAFVLGFAGAVERWYALDEVIRAFPAIRKEHPNAELLIVGGSLFTGYLEELRALAADLGVGREVHFTGAVDYRDLPGYVAPMDLCLIPLSPPQWVDIALPNKYFEYSACGKPILSTPIPDMLRMSGGRIAVYRDAQEFMERVDEAALGPGRAPAGVEEHSWKKKAEAFETIFARLTGKLR